MLTRHTATAAETAFPAVAWFDLLDGNAEEVALVEAATGLHVPTFAELSEIETSSRLRIEGETLYLSAPLIQRAEATHPRQGTSITTPVGFVLTRHCLITVRFARLNAFTTFAERLGVERETAGPAPDGPSVFVGLADAIVDRLADVLESIGAELDTISQRIFTNQVSEVSRLRRPASEDADLRAILRRIGRSGDLASKIRDSLLGVGRILPFVLTMRGEWLTPDLRRRVETMRQDIASLADYDTHLTNKVQLLLDATLGLISIEQNNIIKVLTVVSVVGVPPTLVASMYGMNFKHMPELDWAWGYPYALAMLLLSAVGPLIWFKLRGWL